MMMLPCMCMAESEFSQVFVMKYLQNYHFIYHIMVHKILKSANLNFFSNQVETSQHISIVSLSSS